MDVKRTYIDPDQEIEQRNRKDFLDVCRYGSIAPEKLEIGGIFINPKNYRIERGMGVFTSECVERIFLTK